MITLDTNVLVYAFDHRHPGRQRTASLLLRLLHDRRMPLALQVCGEFYNVMTRKFDKAPHDAAALTMAIMQSLLLFGASAETVVRAIALAASGRFSFWDANLLTSAEEAGCTHILSEDMSDGTSVGALEIVAPFGADGLSSRARMLLDIDRDDA